MILADRDPQLADRNRFLALDRWTLCNILLCQRDKHGDPDLPPVSTPAPDDGWGSVASRYAWPAWYAALVAAGKAATTTTGKKHGR